ncbi:VWA domain-containing protein [Halorhabdus sp. CUG00001]|uniref:vWA domain-containing protein n=1 Tax=Halorhabdus sp. CUG00001 TaxID=2600297 RepID=UPI00131CB3D2|nr:VWA domain-containing protein [Halorhabdus sp. CUG00001]
MDQERRRFLRLSAIGAGVALAGCGGHLNGDEETDAPIDDWQYDPQPLTEGGASGSSFQTNAAESADLGFAAGGAKNVADFRRNIEAGYLPIPESLPYEGLFYNYYFDTGESGECSSLFCPSYATAITEDPIAGTTDQYFTVGLQSTLDTDSFERKQLNVVIVLDISGSMEAEFDQYYYDRFGNKHTVEDRDTRSKLAVAKDALLALTEHLEPDDRLGIVLFNNEASVAKPLRDVESTAMDAIRGHIREDIRAGGGTNIADGMGEAAAMLGEYSDADPTEVETRQIVVTDAMPNRGQTGDQALQDRLAGYADDCIHTSFVGVGVDFNPALVDQITAVRGANYRAVHSADAFETYLGAEFEYMMTPLVYDLTVELDVPGAVIDTVYGSTAAEDATADLLEVTTLFPSPTEDGNTRGGVVLVKLAGEARGTDLTLRASWEDRSGSTDATTTAIEFPDEAPESFGNTGIRKAVFLARYADLLKNWLIHERDPARIEVTADGAVEAPPADLPRGEWEQQSQPLSVSDPYVSRLERFREYARSEIDAIGDKRLDRELETIETILAAGE